MTTCLISLSDLFWHSFIGWLNLSSEKVQCLKQWLWAVKSKILYSDFSLKMRVRLTFTTVGNCFRYFKVIHRLNGVRPSFECSKVCLPYADIIIFHISRGLVIDKSAPLSLVLWWQSWGLSSLAHVRLTKGNNTNNRNANGSATSLKWCNVAKVPSNLCRD